MARPRIPIDQKIHNNVVKIPESGCWIWIGTLTPYGYGRTTLGRNAGINAHRASYELKHGPIPKGMMALHHCDVRCCVNPDHIFLGTQQDNMADKVCKNRQANGVKHGMSKLTEEQAREAKFGNAKPTELAKKFNCSATIIRQIRGGMYWKHLENK
jgi:hypothetical protein